MDLEESQPPQLNSPSTDMVRCCDCGCSCAKGNGSLSDSSVGSMKRKHDESEEDSKLSIAGFDPNANPKVLIENECAILRETVSSQQQTIEDLYTELDEERNAACTAANEAMSMILRLQKEKAEIQMEARQFERFSEEKMVHDQQEILALEDLLYKREETIQSLTCQMQAYKYRLMSYGLTEAEVEEEMGGMSRNESMGRNSDSSKVESPEHMGRYSDSSKVESPEHNYPPLRCKTNSSNNFEYEEEEDYDVVDIDKYAFGETPLGQDDQLKDLEFRIGQMENTPKSIQEKVIVGDSPKHSRHTRRFSTDRSSSVMAKEKGSDFASVSPSHKFENNLKKTDFLPLSEQPSNMRKADNSSEFGDDMNDKVYTIDSVDNGVPNSGIKETKAKIGVSYDFISTPRKKLNGLDDKDSEIKRLFTRLQALEADRESMRQAIISMGTDKAQMVLLKEIAQHLSKDISQEKMPKKKSSALGNQLFPSVFKWVNAFLFWRRRARRSKFLAGLSPSRAGLLVLLDKSPSMRQWRCISRVRV